MRNPSAVHSRKGSEKYETSSSSRGFFWRYVKKKKWWWWYLLQQQQQQAPAPTLADTATSSFLFRWNDQRSRDYSFLPSCFCCSCFYTLILDFKDLQNSRERAPNLLLADSRDCEHVHSESISDVLTTRERARS